MQRHLDSIKQGTVYEEAEQIDSSYAWNRDLRLMFIRSDRYNPLLAAERMVRWFELKKTLFGLEKLCKTITLDDFSEDDMECMNSGYMQLPPFRDMTGRVIAVGMMKLRKMKHKDSAVRQWKNHMKISVVRWLISGTLFVCMFTMLVSGLFLYLYGGYGDCGGSETRNGLCVLSSRCSQLLECHWKSTIDHAGPHCESSSLLQRSSAIRLGMHGRLRAQSSDKSSFPTALW